MRSILERAKSVRGQIAIIMALAMAGLLGVMALGTDVGLMYYDHLQLQKGADAASLAGATYLNGGITFAAANMNANCASQPDDAAKAACTYAINNGLAYDANSLTINEPGVNLPAGSPSPNLQVIASKNNIPFMFGRMIGLSTFNVAAGATAKATLPTSSARGIFPLGMQCASPCDVSKLVPGQSVPFGIKFSPAFGAAPGNWQWLSTGKGANGVGDAVTNGMPGTYTIGGTVNTKPGDDGNAGPVKTAWDAVMNSCAATSPDPCSNAGNPTSIRQGDPCLVTVPAIDFAGCTGTCSPTIAAFAQVYIESSSSSKIKGNGTSNINACYVKAVDANTVSGSSNAPSLGAIQPPTLIQ